MNVGLAMVAMLVDDYDRGIEAYGKLGFRLAEDSAFDDGKRWVVMNGEGGARLLLAKASGEQVQAIGKQAAGRVGFFLETGDFDGTHARMAAHGVIFEAIPRNEAYGRVAVFRDDYGNRWDLIEPKAKSAP